MTFEPLELAVSHSAAVFSERRPLAGAFAESIDEGGSELRQDIRQEPPGRVQNKDDQRHSQAEQHNYNSAGDPQSQAIDERSHIQERK